MELSDIAAFVECPDGKVISGTENGSILLWEGNFIKCRFVRSGGSPCHDGEITYVELDREERRLVTASTDGFIRWWNFDIIDSAEVDSDNSIDYELIPATEYYIGNNRGIKMMVDGGIVGEARTFYIVDTTGCSQSIYFWLGEEPEPQVRPGLVKRRSIRDIVILNPVKKIRRLSMVIADMSPEFKNMPPKKIPVIEKVKTEELSVKTEMEMGVVESEIDQTINGSSSEEKKDNAIENKESKDENTDKDKDKDISAIDSSILTPTTVSVPGSVPSDIPVGVTVAVGVAVAVPEVALSLSGASYAIKPVTKTFSDHHAGPITGEFYIE